MNGIIRILALATLMLVLVAVPAAAESASKTTGPYIGGSVGGSFIEGTVSDIDTFNSEDVGYKLFAGYRWQLLGIEGGYVDFGDMSGTILGDPADLKLTGWDLTGVLFIPIGPLDILFKAGWFMWDAELKSTTSFDLSDSDPMYGAGLAFRFGSFSLRGEVEYFDVSDIEDAYMTSLGLTYMF